MKKIQLVVFMLCFISMPAFATEFFCSSGNVTCLIAAINTANLSAGPHTINLEPGTYTLTTVDNNTDNPNGLPSIRSTMTIRQDSLSGQIMRDPGAPLFRLFHIAEQGNLTLHGLKLSNGNNRFGDFEGIGGGAIYNRGRLSLERVALSDNEHFSNGGGGGALRNDGRAVIVDSSFVNNLANCIQVPCGAAIRNTGEVTLIRGIVRANRADGNAITSSGTLTIRDSSIVENFTNFGGANINISLGQATITNTTVGKNRTSASAGGISVSGAVVRILNSTIAENVGFRTAGFAGGIQNSLGTVELQNTILAKNTVSPAPVEPSDCRGLITSLGNNIVGTLANCQLFNQQTSDTIGDPGLGQLAGSYFPLLPGSPGINSGNNAVCPPTDQLGTPRNGSCDIGAVEFYPVVNNLVALGNPTTSFDPTPVPGGPAGSFRITAEFTNISTQPIIHPFLEVLELSGENVLLNADNGPGGVGARLTLPSSATTPFSPGATETFQFIIALQKTEPFTFNVNMLGQPGTSNLVASSR